MERRARGLKDPRMRAPQCSCDSVAQLFPSVYVRQRNVNETPKLINDSTVGCVLETTRPNAIPRLRNGCGAGERAEPSSIQTHGGATKTPKSQRAIHLSY